MFKRKENGKGFLGIPAGPYSSIVGFAIAIILCGFGAYAFLNLTEVVKWVGQPFLFFPNAFGMIDLPSRAEVAQVAAPAGSTFDVELTRTGPYNIFRSVWDDWGNAPGRGPSIAIEGPDGWIDLQFTNRGARPYDSPLGKGYVIYHFEIDQPGHYTVSIGRNTDNFESVLEIALVPDYISGHETTIRWVFILQIALLLLPVSAFVYIRFLKPYLEEVEVDFKSQDKKRETMDDFLYDLKRGKKR